MPGQDAGVLFPARVTVFGAVYGNHLPTVARPEPAMIHPPEREAIALPVCEAITPPERWAIAPPEHGASPGPGSAPSR